MHRICSYVAVHVPETRSFVDLLQQQCGIDWDSVMNGSTVYFMVDAREAWDWMVSGEATKRWTRSRL